MQPVLECKQLTKRYGSLNALDAIDMVLPRGKIVGLLGPNGSGKTTFLKLAAGLLTPSSGSITISGYPIGVETKKRVSFLPERGYFNRGMKVSTVLIYVRYYKNLMTDEGYLTFTLPVTSAQQLSSKLISTLVCQIIAFIAVLVSVAVSLLIGLGIGGLIDTSFWLSIEMGLKNIWYSLTSMGTGYVVMMGVFMLLSWITSDLLMFLAITLGNLAAKKGKVIASIGFYFALSYGLEIFILVATFAAFGDVFDMINVSIWYVVLIWNVIYAAAGVIAYWLTEKLQRTKLNLN